jgi:hypothetical protein
MDRADRPIVISRHAAQRMAQRGATREETERVIRTASWKSAQRGKWHARYTFRFDAVSPVNGRSYTCKTVDVIFVENPASIVVVTVKVYYHD